MEVVCDAAARRKLGLDAAQGAVALSRLGVDPVAAMMCAFTNSLSRCYVNNLYPEQPQGVMRQGK
jgi:hypothetical protein